MGKLLRRVLSLGVIVFALGVTAPGLGGAAETEGSNSVYWSNSGGDVMSDAALDNSGGGNLTFTGTSVTGPSGTAIDSVGGVIYWANDGSPGTIGWARLNGPGGVLNTSGATVDEPRGLAIDPAAKRLYWANSAGGSGGNGSISWAALSGAASPGGADLVSGPGVTSPYGVTVDPASGRIYWANSAGPGPGTGPGSIMSANLDGSDVSALPIIGATVNSPHGVALDPLTKTLYWANSPAGTHSGTISFWNLGSETGGDLPAAAPVDEPEGIAVDPVAGRLYWANAGDDTIAYERLDGLGGGTLKTSGATVSKPSFPALLVAPAGAGAPQLSGGNTVGSSLTCQRGSWAGDLTSAFYFRAPRNISWQWTLNGSTIAGATTGAYTAVTAGSYACEELGKNHAGTTTQTSAALLVSGQPAAVTGQAASAGATDAVLAGTVDPQYATTSYHFEYGLTAAYGAVAPGSDGLLGPDGTVHPITQEVTGLEPNRTYHYRLVATNPNGVSYGADQVVATRSGPVAATGAPRAVSDTSATLTGVVNPENLATDYYFQFGPTVSYGSRIPADNAQAGDDQGGHEMVQVLTGLAAGTTYHFRLVAVNAVGVSYGSDMTFTTSAHPATPAEPRVTLPGRISTIGAELRLSIACAGAAGQACRVSVTTRVVERLSNDGRRILGVQAAAATGRRRTVVVSAGSYSLAAGGTRHVSIRLNATGRMLHSRFGRLPATITVRSGTAGSGRLVKSARVTFAADPPKLRLLTAPVAESDGLKLGLRCSGGNTQRCTAIVELTTYESFAADGRTITRLTSKPTAGSTAVTVGHARYGVRAGRSDRRQVRLTDRGRSLLQEFKRVPASLTVLMRSGDRRVTAAHRTVTFTRRITSP